MALELETLKKAKTAIGQSATLTSLGASAGAIMAIMTFLSFMHVDVIPFAWASDVDKIQASIDRLTQVIEDQTKATLIIQRDNYRAQLETAKDELQKNPSSRSAKNEVDRLEQAIADIDKKIEKLDH